MFVCVRRLPLSASIYMRVCVCVCERERESSKTLFYKNCSLGSVKNLTTSPC